MNRKCLIWLGETLLAREKKLNSCLNRKSNNHRGEIEDFTNKEPFFFSIDKINLFNLNPSILSYKQDYRYIREIDTDASMNTRTIERLDRIFIKAYLHEPFLCHTHDDVRLTRELPATVDQFNIYHGGIIKVQSSKKWLVPRSSKWRGATISFPFFFSFFFKKHFILPYCFQRIFVDIPLVFFSFPFPRNHREGKNNFYNQTNSFFVKTFLFQKRFEYHRWKFFFFNFQREREKGKNRWRRSSSSVDDKRFTTLGAIQSGDILTRL